MFDRSQVKRDFSNEQIIRVAQSLGSDDYRRDGTQEDSPLIFQTICHNPAHCGSYKLYYYPDSKQFHCFTQCSCNFDLYELVMRSKKCSFFEATQYIGATLGLSDPSKLGFFSREEEQEQEQTDDWEILNRFTARRNQLTKIAAPYQKYPLSILEYWNRLSPVEWLREGISSQAIERFSIRFSVADNEIIIPHFDSQGNLIGIRSRALDKQRVLEGKKYMPTYLEGSDFRHAIRNNLYGLHIVAPAVRRSKKILLCESEKAAMQSYSFYGEDSFTVAVCGSNISSAQRDTVLSLGVKEVFIGFDKEYKIAYSPQSDAYAEKLIRLASMFSPFVTTYILFDTKDLLGYKDAPTDRGQAVLEELMKTKFEIETLDGG